MELSAQLSDLIINELEAHYTHYYIANIDALFVRTREIVVQINFYEHELYVAPTVCIATGHRIQYADPRFVERTLDAIKAMAEFQRYYIGYVSGARPESSDFRSVYPVLLSQHMGE